MNLDEREISLVVRALTKLRDEAEHQTHPDRGYMRVRGAAWHCCKRVVTEADELLARIEKERSDGN